MKTIMMGLITTLLTIGGAGIMTGNAQTDSAYRKQHPMMQDTTRKGVQTAPPKKKVGLSKDSLDKHRPPRDTNYIKPGYPNGTQGGSGPR